MDEYQKQVLDLTGALGPTTTAYWPITDTPDPYNMSSQPLYINNNGMYTASFDKPADYYNIISGFGKKMDKRLKELKKRAKLSKKLEHIIKNPKLSKKLK